MVYSKTDGLEVSCFTVLQYSLKYVKQPFNLEHETKVSAQAFYPFTLQCCKMARHTKNLAANAS